MQVARTLFAGSLGAMLAASSVGCDTWERDPLTADDVERTPPPPRAPSARSLALDDDFDRAVAVWLASQPPPPPPLPPRRTVSLGFIGDAPLQPLPPPADPPWAHFSCGACDPDYELP